MAVYTGPEIVAGRVVSVNEKGIRLDGHDSWMNVSKFAVGVILPERGQTVSVTLDKAGFLRAVEPTSGAATSNGAGPTPASVTKDRTITRLAVLKAAAEFGAARPGLKSGEVLKIAESWERWVTREPDEGSELVDVF